MDGTLFDTERLYTIAWKQVGEEMGYSITTELLNQCRERRQRLSDTFGEYLKIHLEKNFVMKMKYPEAFYEFYKEKMMILDAKPNAAHLKLALGGGNLHICRSEL